jgi:hypothetical protein
VIRLEKGEEGCRTKRGFRQLMLQLVSNSIEASEGMEPETTVRHCDLAAGLLQRAKDIHLEDMGAC